MSISGDDPKPKAREQPAPEHTDYGALGVQLVYGRRPDDSLVHISEAALGLQCDCACPSCGGRLVARKGRQVAHHFAHYGAACGSAAETNAHIWAKRVLEQTKTIVLPAIEAAIDEHLHVARPAAPFHFEEVRLERRMGDIRPDVVCAAQGRELIVEIFVTHRCGEEKVARMRAQGVSGIEVDLSRFRGAIDETAVARALLFDAPRTWLFNPRLDEARSALNAKISEGRAAARRKLERWVDEFVTSVRTARPLLSERHRREMDLVLALGRYDLLDLECPPAEGFVVPRAHWQAAIYARAVIARIQEQAYAEPIEALDVLDLIHDCLAPALQRRLGHERLAALGELAPSFILPTVSIEAYLARLAEAGVLYTGRFGPVVSFAERRRMERRLADVWRPAGQRLEGPGS